MSGNGAELSSDGEKESISSKAIVKLPVSPQPEGAANSAENMPEVNAEFAEDVEEAMAVVAGPVTVIMAVPIVRWWTSSLDGFNCGMHVPTSEDDETFL